MDLLFAGSLCGVDFSYVLSTVFAARKRMRSTARECDGVMTAPAHNLCKMAQPAMKA
jgi:hypothetical protein